MQEGMMAKASRLAAQQAAVLGQMVDILAAMDARLERMEKKIDGPVIGGPVAKPKVAEVPKVAKPEG
jgi:hypothetical protein